MCALQMDDAQFDKFIEIVLDAPKRDCTAKIGAFDIASGTEDIPIVKNASGQDDIAL